MGRPRWKFGRPEPSTARKDHKVVSDNTQGDLEVARALRFTQAVTLSPAPLGNALWCDGSNNLRADNFASVETAGFVSSSPAVSTPTLVSGTALKDATGLNSMWYIPIVGGASGTFVVAVGPTSSVANNLSGTANCPANTTQVFDLLLPANWYVKVTLSVCTFGTITVITL